MIRIKDIDWKESESSMYQAIRCDAYIRDKCFLTVVEDKKHTTITPTESPVLVSRYYIHTISSIFKVSGNQGIEEWGWFDNLEECKKKAEEVITNEILSFIDMRDHKIDEVLK